MNEEDYSYAFLIPLITGYIIWERRCQIANTPISINWTGGVFFFFFLIISLYGILGSSPSAVRPAIPLIILAITLFCFGWEMLKVLGFPLSILIFMIPLPTMFGTYVTIHLKTISTLLGKAILILAGISVFVEGNVIDLGFTQLQVANACSGLRYVLPLFALGVLCAYFFEKTRWKQVLLALSTIPIAILNNGIRIGATGILARYYGPEAAEGFFHGFSGWLVFMFAFSMLFFIHFILKKIFPQKITAIQKKDNKQEIGNDCVKSKSITFAVIITSASMMVVGLLNYTSTALPPIKIKNGLSSFPLTIKNWQGRSDQIDDEMIKASGAEDAFNGFYQNEKGEMIYLYMGYRSSAFGESENFFHSPNVCMPSSGWSTLDTYTHEIKGIAGFGVVKVKAMISEKMGQKQLVYYWFQTKNKTSNNININRFHLALNAIKHDNTHDLFIRPITPVLASESVEDAQARMDGFLRETMAVLLEFLKDNQYVEGK